MVGCVKYGLDCWIMDVEGKCSADAVARGLPACKWAGRKGHQEIGDLMVRALRIQRKRENGQEQARTRARRVRLWPLVQKLR